MTTSRPKPVEAPIPRLGNFFMPIYSVYDLTGEVDCLEVAKQNADHHYSAERALDHVEWLELFVDDRFFLQNHSIRHSELERVNPDTAATVRKEFGLQDPYLNILTVHFQDERDQIAFLEHAYGDRL